MEETINNKAKKETCNYLREAKRATDCARDDDGNNNNNTGNNNGICNN